MNCKTSLSYLHICTTIALSLSQSLLVTSLNFHVWEKNNAQNAARSFFSEPILHTFTLEFNLTDILAEVILHNVYYYYVWNYHYESADSILIQSSYVREGIEQKPCTKRCLFFFWTFKVIFVHPPDVREDIEKIHTQNAAIFFSETSDPSACNLDTLAKKLR